MDLLNGLIKKLQNPTILHSTAAIYFDPVPAVVQILIIGGGKSLTGLKFAGKRRFTDIVYGKGIGGIYKEFYFFVNKDVFADAII